MIPEGSFDALTRVLGRPFRVLKEGFKKLYRKLMLDLRPLSTACNPEMSVIMKMLLSNAQISLGVRKHP